VGEKVPRWLRCPKCESPGGLLAVGDFMGRDDRTHEEDLDAYRTFSDREP
jgi:hypothetical protein